MKAFHSVRQTLFFTYAIVSPANAPPSSTSAAATPRYAHRLGSSTAFGCSSSSGETGAAYEGATLVKLPSTRRSILSSLMIEVAEVVGDGDAAARSMAASPYLGLGIQATASGAGKGVESNSIASLQLLRMSGYRVGRSTGMLY